MILPIGNNKKGFTLIELIIVVLIIGTFSLFALPAFQNFSRGIALEKNSRHLMQTIRFAHFRSISEGIKYRLSFNLEENSYCIERETDNQDEFEKFSTSLIKKRKLGKGVEFLKIVTPRGEEKFSGQAHLYFEPDGSSENSLIYLENNEGKINTLSITAPTSRVLIYDHLHTGSVINR